MFKLTTNFQLEELVHPLIHEKVGDRAKDFLCPMLAYTWQAIRDELDEGITINNWLWGGNFVNSGLRLPKGDIGADLSAHKFGNAGDGKFAKSPSSDVHRMIMDNPDKFPYITRMESTLATPTWLHIETSSKHRIGNIKVFQP